MSTIEKLRLQVEQADQRLGASASQNRKYAQRLVKLLGRVEIEHQGRKIRTARLHLENDELRGMLHALLLAIEVGSDASMDAVLQDLEARMTALVTDPGPIPESTETPAESNDEIASEFEPDLSDAVDDLEPDPRISLATAVARLMELVNADLVPSPGPSQSAQPARSPAIAKALDELRAVFADERQISAPEGAIGETTEAEALSLVENETGEITDADPEPADLADDTPDERPAELQTSDESPAAGGDPGIRQILKHVREEIEAVRQSAAE